MKFALLLLSAAVVATPAPAQLKPEAPLGTRIPEAPDFFPVDRTQDVMRKFAECAVKKFPELSHRMVLDSSKVRVDKLYLKVADPDCLVQATAYQYGVVQLRMSPESFRYAVADVLVARNLQSLAPTQVLSAARLPKPAISPSDYLAKASDKRVGFTQKDYDEARQRDVAAIALSDFGECVVRANPQGARDLLRTKINSNEELGALRAIMPSFSGCLDRGSTLKTDRSTVRGAVALTYYRLAYAPRVATDAVVNSK